MGTVWRAYDELLGRRVAVKELHVDAGTAPHSVLREARAVARVRNPHVIVVHDVVLEEGVPYIVMELVDGVSLAQRMAVRGPVSAPEAARIGLALLSALRAAHALGVLHRDLKPANVLVEEATGRVVLTDFGIAQLAGSTTITDAGTFVGSPEYTAPERMQGAQAGPETDLWSLGALLCAALTGQSPFHRDSLGGVLHAVVEEEVRPPLAAGPILPAVRGLLERDPRCRIGAVEAERLLRAYLETGTTPEYVPLDPPAQPPRPRPPLSRWGGRRHTPAPPRDPRTGPRPGYPGYASHPTGTHPVGTHPAGAHPTATHLTTPPGAQSRARGATPLVATALLAALAGAGAAGVLLLRGEGEGGGGRTAAPPPVTTVTTVTATPPAGPAGQGGTAAPVPEGYRSVLDPQGFSLTVPEGYERSADDRRVYYTSPDQAFRIGVRTQAPVPSGPLGTMRLAHANGPRTHPGYRDARVVATTHNGLPAALWEFVWDGFSSQEDSRRTYDLCWDESGRMYDVWVSGPVTRRDEVKRHFDTLLDSFVVER
ncbi:serine/threonine-protein kinase [Streptomyces sp. NPDC050856]|uniref:serine/threonine-protein kinase n=1 Tax=Streptomyces sp. NPDC050856 TaxID=3154939 RepID=UPI0033E69B72